MDTIYWNKTVDSVPENDDTLCDTISANGMQQRLYFVGGLWFTTNKEMYVYYTPMFWRPVNG